MREAGRACVSEAWGRDGDRDIYRWGEGQRDRDGDQGGWDGDRDRIGWDRMIEKDRMIEGDAGGGWVWLGMSRPLWLYRLTRPWRPRREGT